MEFVKSTEKFSAGFSSQRIAGTGYSKAKYDEIVIDAASRCTGENSSYKGIGCISANNSSRLLLDYKAKHPEVYDEILRILFEKGRGAELSHIKLELGADINSSSGTEPATMRYADEKPDVTRGAGFVFAADALKINPELTIDLLRWGEPGWVKNAFEKSKENGYKARYKWYISTIDEAYDRLGLRFTHISPDANETGEADADWIIYFTERLKAEKDKGYDYSSIKIVASDEVGTRTIAAKMIENERLRSCVDIIGLHYTTYGDENTSRLHSEFGKEIWYSEGAAPLNVPRLAFKKDMCGISGHNTAVDIANRIINSWYNGRMTMYELQPAVSAYYDGSCYYPKHIIKANEPWSGHYEICAGFWTVMHFTRFAGKNWYPVISACYGDGDENHYIENTTSNYMTLMPESGEEFTMILTNDSPSTRNYCISFKNCDFSGRYISLIETAPPDIDGQYDSGWFRLIDVRKTDGDMLEISVKPGSILTVTTLNASFAAGTEIVENNSPAPQRMLMKYKDDFKYKSYGEDFLGNRGYSPMYTTDQGGAFEVAEYEGRMWLEQKITHDILPENWRFRGTPDPITTLGDDAWYNYTAQISFVLVADSDDNYIGLGVRYNSAVACEVTSNCGFAVKVYPSGRWEFLYMDDVVDSGNAEGFCWRDKHTILIMASDSMYFAYLDGRLLGSYIEKGCFQPCGRVSLLSGYYRNRFADLEIKPIPDKVKYAALFDALEPEMSYEGNVVLHSCDSYKYSNRTSALISEGASFEFVYRGYGFALCGTVENASLRIELDGKIIADNKLVGGTEYRQAFCKCTCERYSLHRVRVTVLEGQITLDSAAVWMNSLTSPEFSDYKSAEEVSAKKKNITKAAAAVTAGAAAAAIALKLRSKIKKRKNKI